MTRCMSYWSYPIRDERHRRHSGSVRNVGSMQPSRLPISREISLDPVEDGVCPSPEGIWNSVPAGYLTIEEARNQLHWKLFGESIDAKKAVRRGRTVDQKERTFFRGLTIVWNRVKESERLLRTAFQTAELETFVYNSSSNRFLRCPAFYWSSSAFPTRPFVGGIRPTGDQRLRPYSGRLLLTRDAPFQKWLTRRHLRKNLPMSRGRPKQNETSTRLGRPPIHPWDDFEAEVRRLLSRYGEPNAKSSKARWQKNADLEGRMMDWCVEQWDYEPPRSTMQPYLNRAIEGYRTSNAVVGGDRKD